MGGLGHPGQLLCISDTDEYRTFVSGKHIIIIMIIIIIIHGVLLPALYTCPGMHYKWVLQTKV